jgi:tetratricopeptide (TPR) repeat protein
MDAPVALLKFIAKASLNAVSGGVAGDFVVEVLPGIARDVWGWWGKDRSDAERRADVQALAVVPGAEMSKAVKQVVAEVAGARPPEVQLRLESFLKIVPAAVQRSLQRPGDPRGHTVPSSLPLHRAEDLLPFLPQRLPRFKPGDRPLGAVDWELVKLLGVGGFGEVWRARNPHFPNMPHVALKFCLAPAARESLKHEAAVLNRVTSQGPRPGIVPLLRTYLSADPPCLEYEFIEGGDLAGAIYAHQAAGGPVTPATATKIVLALARAVAQAHALAPPIVHRDLKPANVLVRRKDGKSEFLITDFGIGGVVASQALEQTRGGTSHPLMTALKGAHTPLYASPEQKKGEPPDPRDDVHALGVIWYQLLIGDFSEGAPAGGAWRRGLSQQGVSEKLLELLDSCFDSKAANRPADAAAVAGQIEEALRARPPDHLALAAAALARNDFDAAVAACARALEAAPPPPEARRLRAKAFVALGRDEDALEDLQAVAASAEATTADRAEQERVAEIVNLRLTQKRLAEAAAALAGGDADAAVTACTRALEGSPQSAEAYRLRAHAYEALGKLHEALADLRGLVALPDATDADRAERDRLEKVIGPPAPGPVEPPDPSAAAVAALAQGDFQAAIAACTQALKATPPPLRAYRLRARAYAGKNKLDHALRDFNSVIASPDATPGDFVERGRLFVRKGQPDKAVKDFTQALTRDQKSFAAYVARARAYVAAGSLELGFADFDAALKIAPQAGEVFYYRGEAQLSRGAHEQALADFNEAIRLEPGDARCYVGRGRVYLALGQVEQALREFIQATQTDPKYAEAYLERGIAHARLGQDAQAVADFSQATALDWRLGPAYAHRARANARLRQYAKAEGDFGRAIQREPRDAMLYVGRGDVLAARGRLEEALEDYARAIKVDKNLAEAHYRRGAVYLQSGQPGRAANSFTRALELTPDHLEARALRGLVYAGKGQFDEAQADAEECSRRNPDLPLVHYIRGLVLAGKNLLNEALLELSDAIRLDASVASFYADRGLVHHAQGNYDLAVADFKQAIKLDPKEARHYLNRARAYEKGGDKDKAQADRERAARLGEKGKKEQ